MLGKGVGVVVFQRFQDAGLAVNLGRLPVYIIKGADVVQPAGVVLVRVRDQDGIQVTDVVRKHLGTEVGAGVHKDREPVVPDEGR